MIPWLDSNSLEFPPLRQALDEPNGLLAAGGDLSSQRLLAAYRRGIFPWYNPGEPILWWSPDPRCILLPGDLHLSRSLRKRLRRNDYHVTLDRAFERVVTACTEPRRGQSGTWITREMHAAYVNLHHQGVAHSVEVWTGDELVGGLYGLAIGAVFFGESMFSLQRDASKIGFAWCVTQLRHWGYQLVDCQVYSDHLASLGATEISRNAFARWLAPLCSQRLQHEWTFTIHREMIVGKNHDQPA